MASFARSFSRLARARAFPPSAVRFSKHPVASRALSVHINQACEKMDCDVKEVCPSHVSNVNSRKRSAGESSSAKNGDADSRADTSVSTEAEVKQHPSVSSMFPSGPGSTDPSEWPLRSFYKRELPDSCVRFGSEEGIKLFQESLAKGTAAAYFPLAEQFRTQDEPAFCGLSTLTMVLNSLHIDPGRIWKGGWRWFSEEMLDCCEKIEKIRKVGITFEKLACLASCNGANVDTWRADGGEPDIEHFRKAVKETSGQSQYFIIVSYSRSPLGQTGDGHFSPVAAYHEDSDMVLIMDTARFKYPPHWVKLETLVHAMQKEDKGTGEARGFMKLERASGDGSPSSSVLFVLTLRKGFDEKALRNIRMFFQSVKQTKLKKEVENKAGRDCSTCSNDGLEISSYVSCFFAAAPSELFRNVGTMVEEFNVDPAKFGQLSVRPKYQDQVSELLQEIRALPLYPHVVTAANSQKEKLGSILNATHGLELLTVLLMAAPVSNLSECGTRVDRVMRESEDGASEIVRNEIKALRNQLWTVFRPKAGMSGDVKMTGMSN